MDPALAALELAIRSYAPSAPFPIQTVKSVPTIYFLAHTGNVSLFTLLQSHDYCGMDPHELNAADHKLPGTTPLWAALATNHLEIAKLILTFKVDANAAVTIPPLASIYDPALAPSPLIIASQNGHLATCELILHHTISLPHFPGFLESTLPTKDKPTALFKAAQNNRPSIVSLLVRAGANVNSATADDHATPLSIAAYHGHVEVVELLCGAAGIDVDGHKRAMMNPICAAVKGGHGGVVEVLVKSGAATNVVCQGMKLMQFLGLCRRTDEVVAGVCRQIVGYASRCEDTSERNKQRHAANRRR